MKIAVGICTLHLLLPYCYSLKDKRSLLAKIINPLKKKYNISIAEVDNHDIWKKTTIGISLVSNNSTLIRKILEDIVDYLLCFDNVTLLDYEIEFV